MKPTRVMLVPRPGYLCREAGLFVAQLDDLTGSMFEDLQDIEPDELAWQSAPGMNTIGMLLAHVAIWEVYWVKRGLLGDAEAAVEDVLGIPMHGDGIPLPPGGAPPAAMSGKSLAWFRDLVDRARAFSSTRLREATDADLDREFVRPSLVEDKTYLLNVRWTLFHIVEHLAGHYGQMLLMRHAYANRAGVS